MESTMNPEQELLSRATVFSKYSRWWAELGRREIYPEIVARNRQMHLDHIKGNPNEDKLREKIDWAYHYVLDSKVFPSMRSFQFAGEPIHRANNRIYNCAYRQADEVSFFSDLMYLLLGGSGVGYSVRKEHVAELPTLKRPGSTYQYTIADSIEGWAKAVDVLLSAYLEGGPEPVFDYSQIRERGTILKTSGGRAPGPEPLRRSLNELRVRLNRADKRLTPIEVHDMATIIARAVLSGGIRRSAMISLFSPDDEEMLYAKSGQWWEVNPDRAYANNSAVLVRGLDDYRFSGIFDITRSSGSGEPGIFWADRPEYGTNPCAEITLNNKQFCNLTTIDVGTVCCQEDFEDRARAAAIIGSLQASYTDFHFISEGWKEQTEREALLGVSMTGVASRAIENLDATSAADIATEENAEMAQLLGINPAARVTTIKPEGTASVVAGTSSGIHAWHDNYYIRRTRYNKGEPIAQFFMAELPYSETSDPDNPEIVEDDVWNNEQIVVSIPQKAPGGAVTRHEGAVSLLERVKHYYNNWVIPGTRYGNTTNNISATVNVKPDEWDEVQEWMWENRDHYNGLSIMPFDSGNYAQVPFESITREKYEEMAKKIPDLDFTRIDETEDYTDLTGELACAGGACELPWG